MNKEIKALCRAEDFREFINLFVEHLKVADSDEEKIDSLKNEAVDVLIDIFEQEKYQSLSD